MIDAVISNAFLSPEWIRTEAPVALVVLPLIMAAICAVMPKERLAWLIVLGTTIVSTALSFVILQEVLANDVIAYAMGGWEPPLGIAFHIDGLNAPVLLLISLIGVICTIYAMRSVIAEIEPKKRAPFYAAFLVSFADCWVWLLRAMLLMSSFSSKSPRFRPMFWLQWAQAAIAGRLIRLIII